MEKTFQVNIITPGKLAITAEIQSLHTKSKDGEVEFRRNHTPIILSTVPAVTKIVKADGSSEIYFTSSGVVVIKNNVIRFCCDSAEKPEDIDINRAMEAKERAEARIKKYNRSDTEMDIDRAMLALAKANARIEAVNIYKN